MHIVHQDALGKLAVVGVMFNEHEQESEFVEAMWEVRSGDETPMADLGLISQLDLTNFYTYKGSLTTPPCTEGLRWVVLKDIQPISARQLGNFREKYMPQFDHAKVGNNRVVQPLNGRDLYISQFGSQQIIEDVAYVSESISSAENMVNDLFEMFDSASSLVASSAAVAATVALF